VAAVLRRWGQSGRDACRLGREHGHRKEGCPDLICGSAKTSMAASVGEITVRYLGVYLDMLNTGAVMKLKKKVAVVAVTEIRLTLKIASNGTGGL
jgi:hypothetical protein